MRLYGLICRFLIHLYISFLLFRAQIFKAMLAQRYRKIVPLHIKLRCESLVMTVQRYRSAKIASKM